MESDGTARDRRPTAPDRGKTVDGEPGDNSDGYNVDDAEGDNTAATRQEQRPTDRQHIEADDDSSMAQFDPVREGGMGAASR